MKLLSPRISTDAYDKHLQKGESDLARKMFYEVFEYASTASDAIRTLSSTRKAPTHFEPDTPSPDDWPVYTMTAGGHLWQWDCGWWEINKRGQRISTTPLGHLAFRRKPLAKPRDKWIKLSRPDGPWRRHIDTILHHPILGINGKVSYTDGLHAFFHFTDAEGTEHVREVQLSALQEIAVPMAKPAKTPKPAPKPKTIDKAKLAAMVLDLLK